jgi:hypothetical protein
MNNASVKLGLTALGLLSGLCAPIPALAEGASLSGSSQILDQCQYSVLATNLAMPKKFGATNTSVCVDIPVEVHQAKMVFNMDTDTVDGNGNSNGLKHMVMMGNVIKDQIKQGLIKPEDVSIIGILHGSAIKWATKAVPPQQKNFIDQIFQLRRDGLNIQLEACAAAMNGAGLTKKNLFSYDAEGKPDLAAGGRIYVNQGAFARELDLENHGYAYFEEGYDYHEKK